MTPTTIRKIRKGDNAALANIIRGCFDDFNAPTDGTVYVDPTTDNLFELFKMPKSVCWVAISEGALAGCCGIFPTEGLPDGCAELVKFYVSAEFRGRGIGRQLINRAVLSANEFGYQSIYIESLPQFSGAVRLYERMGFKALEQPMGNSGHTGCNIWMYKRIS